MVTINENDYSKRTESNQLAPKLGPSGFSDAFIQRAVLPPKPVEEVKMSDFIDIPSLVSDDDEESDAESSKSSKKPEKKEKKEPAKSPEKPPQKAVQPLSPEQLKSERATLMKVVVKYVAMKITNLFPPESPRTIDPNEMPLDKFLLILTSRLQLSLPTFMKGIIYLFRYMDIVYLLRYLNQSNNFINYNEMGFNLKKLIVGCFRLTLAKESVSRNWSDITGLSNGEVNRIAKSMVQRLNGKLVVKNIELVRFKMEIFRFVKMVTTAA